ncbi:glycosyltransferase family 4 protein [Saccharopolyspora phatthalungensis]|uniref:2-deoxystreptamine N-acetyl-D-glucosaminyltransferase/2-deoxystreptamine glucosyltransferase n=1 Tax=Saccharopolyspora phatthalungensis TaxID=664693 RepID=A0A840QIS3_9PSEU|nr:glycosyltransferase family 4 protein [Saccharopolyspora phatthalungensis]MBB5158808.1 2-deoxystreptamine N-acetyl-D-glucosaminyltransferase/2-deoxystreptamine glucosyltransferase [Saccharopolyspora phatthalungensis]
MRVLRLTPFFHHDCVDSWPAEFDSVGGMQVQILRLSRALAERGVRQQVLTVGFPGLPRVREDRPGLTVRITRAPLPRIRSELTGLVGLNQAWLAAALAECVRLRRTWRPDLIQVHADGQLWALLAGPLASRVLGVPYSVALHCSRLAVYQPMSAMDRWQHGIIREVERRTLRGAAGVCTLTERTADLVASRSGLARDWLDVVPDAVDLAEATPDPLAAAAFRARTSAGSSGRVVAFVGRIAHEKGWSDFVRVATMIDASSTADARVVFAVVGDGPQRDRMRRMVADHGLSERFIFTGFLPNQKIPAVMAAADVVVMPSRHEELGGSAIEAMLAGTPVACYAVGGLCDTVGRVTPDLAVPNGDVAALAQAVGRVFSDTDAVRAEVRAGRPWLAESFGLRGSVERALEHYERVLGGWCRTGF